MTQARPEADATPRERRSRIKRGRILDAGERLFARHGYTKTTVDEIALAASVSKGLIYLHFPSKEALLEAVLEREITAWSRASVRSVHETREAKGTTAEMIARAVRASIDHARNNPLLLGILAQDPRLLLPRPANGEPPRATVEKGYRALLEPLVRRGIERGDLRGDLDVARTAHAIWLLHDGLVRALFVGGADLPGGWDAAEPTSDEHDETHRPGDALVEATISLMSHGIVGPRER
jgi:AcrR family transcriptional regulator